MVLYVLSCCRLGWFLLFFSFLTNLSESYQIFTTFFCFNRWNHSKNKTGLWTSYAMDSVEAWKTSAARWILAGVLLALLSTLGNCLQVKNTQVRIKINWIHIFSAHKCWITFPFFFFLVWTDIEKFFSLIANSQAQRLDDQRVSLASLPGITNENATFTAAGDSSYLCYMVSKVQVIAFP